MMISQKVSIFLFYRSSRLTHSKFFSSIPVFSLKQPNHKPILQQQSNMLKSMQNSYSMIGNRSDKGVLIYVGREGNRLRKILGTFYALSVGITSVSPFLLTLTSSVFVTCFMSVNIFIFVVLNPLLFYQFGKRHVNQLHHDSSSDTYTASLISPFVWKDKQITFKPSECKMPANPSAFTSFYVNKYPMFVNSDEMNYVDYMHMLRYANQFDFENPDRHEQYEKERSKKN